jgi:hypothetical protein
MKLYMFRKVRLSIIRSLFTVHSAMVYVIQGCRQLSSSRSTLVPSRYLDVTSRMLFCVSLTFIKTHIALQFSVILPVPNFVKICPSVFRVETRGRTGRHDLSLRSVFTLLAERNKSQRTVMLRKSCL